MPNEIARASNDFADPAGHNRTGKCRQIWIAGAGIDGGSCGTLALPVQQGVIVTDVEDNSIAAAQDIQREDVITEVDGKPVTNVQSFRDALNKADPKRGVLLYLDRKGSKTFAVLKAGG